MPNAIKGAVSANQTQSNVINQSIRSPVRMDYVIASRGIDLNMFTFAELHPLAMAGLSLMDAVSNGTLIVNDRVELAKAEQAAALLNRLQTLQGAIRSGRSENLLAATAAMIEAEGGAA